jgi:hypothetical protein
MKINVTKILLFVILALMGYNTVKDYFFPDNSEFEKIRKELVTTSELVKLKDGRYEKLLNDYNSSKELLKDLKNSNQSLYRDIKKSNEKVVAVTRALIGFKDKLDSLSLNKPIEDIIRDKDTLDFFYPNKTSPLITHSLLFTSNITAESYWKFKPTPLDLVITETKKGIFKTNIGVNPYVSISSLEVKTIPFETEKSNFGWAYGGGLWKGPEEIGVDLYGGVRISDFNILLRLQPSTQPQIGVGVIYNPK